MTQRSFVQFSSSICPGKMKSFEWRKLLKKHISFSEFASRHYSESTTMLYYYQSPITENEKLGVISTAVCIIISFVAFLMGLG